jgi:small-conductance mechanosensitive channel
LLGFYSYQKLLYKQSMISKILTVIWSIVFVLSAIFLAPPISVFAQGGLTDLNKDIPAVDQLDSQAARVQNIQGTVVDLEKTLTQLRREKEILDKQNLELKIEKTGLEGELKQAQADIKVIQESETSNEVVGGNGRETLAQLETKINTDTKRIADIDGQRARNQTRLETLDRQIVLVEASVSEKKKDVESEVSGLTSQAYEIILKFMQYIGLIILIWALAKIFQTLVRRYTTNANIRSISYIAITFLAIAATIIATIYAFIGNLNVLVTGLGLLSAALVVALQDFVSSFFAWILISTKRQYRVGDVITVDTPSRDIYGKVTEINLLRTVLQEKVGGIKQDREQITGRTLIFPNNIILKQAVRNNTLDNDLIWQTMSVTITFESDADLAEELLHKAVHDKFKYMVEHKEVYLDNVFNLKNAYMPKIYIEIADNGPKFTIWFAAKSGRYREVLGVYSRAILKTFREHNIELAYTTYRVIPTS